MRSEAALRLRWLLPRRAHMVRATYRSDVVRMTRTGMKSIRDYYGVPAKRDMPIKFQGRKCWILSASKSSMHLHVEFEDGSKAWIHPTWEVEYP